MGVCCPRFSGVQRSFQQNTSDAACVPAEGSRVGGKGTFHSADTAPLPLLINYLKALSPVAGQFLRSGKSVSLRWEPGGRSAAAGPPVTRIAPRFGASLRCTELWVEEPLAVVGSSSYVRYGQLSVELMFSASFYPPHPLHQWASVVTQRVLCSSHVAHCLGGSREKLEPAVTTGEAC